MPRKIESPNRGHNMQTALIVQSCLAEMTPEGRAEIEQLAAMMVESINQRVNVLRPDRRSHFGVTSALELIGALMKAGVL